MEKQLLQFCVEKGFLVDQEVLHLLQEIENPSSAKVFLESLLQHSTKRIVTKHTLTNPQLINHIFSTLPEEHKKSVEKLNIKLGIDLKISGEINLELSNKKDKSEQAIEQDFPKSNVPPRHHNSSFKIIYSPPLSSKKLEVQDFVKHFRSRLLEMKTFLQQRPELKNLISINKLGEQRQQASIIAMVLEKQVTKNKNIVLLLEDMTGSCKALVSVNKPELIKKAEDIVLDSILGFTCSGSREMLFVNDLFFPECVLLERKHSPHEEYAAFIGDLHIGADKFMEKKFLKFIDYVNGPLANKLNYLFVIGDIVCGVGIYPGQEKELIIQDLEGQFQRAAEIFSLFRKDLSIIICPGNHDGVRLMEPQPAFDEKFAWPLHNIENVSLVTNPARVCFGVCGGFDGFNLLMYHGYSFHYFVDVVGHLRRAKATNCPEKIMAFLLKHRHLAPSHTATLYFPDQYDSLLIRETPDILFSGHTHKSAVSYFNNILILSASTWESKTEFQEKMGNEPDFCKVPIFNLKTRAIQILDFE